MKLLPYPLNSFCLFVEIKEMFEFTFLNNINPNFLMYILSFTGKNIPLKFLYRLIYYTFYTGQILWYLTKDSCKICRVMRSHSVSSDIQGKLQIRIEFRAWRYIAFHQRNQSNAPVSKLTLVLIVEATVYIYFRMYVFHLHPLQSQFISNEEALLSFTSSASFCLHHRYR